MAAGPPLPETRPSVSAGKRAHAVHTARGNNVGRSSGPAAAPRADANCATAVHGQPPAPDGRGCTSAPRAPPPVRARDLPETAPSYPTAGVCAGQDPNLPDAPPRLPCAAHPQRRILGLALPSATARHRTCRASRPRSPPPPHGTGPPACGINGPAGPARRRAERLQRRLTAVAAHRARPAPPAATPARHAERARTRQRPRGGAGGAACGPTGRLALARLAFCAVAQQREAHSNLSHFHTHETRPFASCYRSLQTTKDLRH